MTWQVTRIDNGLLPFKESWDSLNESTAKGNPYFHTDFVEALLKHFSSGKEHLLVHRTGGTVSSMLVARPLKPGKWELYVPAQAQVGAFLSSRDTPLASLIPSLPGFALMLDAPCQDPASSVLLQAEAVPSLQSRHARTIAISLRGSFYEYWSSRTRDLRKSMARRIRRAEELGLDLDVRTIEDPAGMADSVARFGELESRGWKGEAGSAVHASNSQGRFYGEVMTRFARRGCTKVYELYFGGKLGASQLCITGGRMLVLLKTTYDESMASHSPGRMLLYYLIQREFALARAERIEFYTNANKDQLAWGTSDRWITNVTLYRNHPARVAHGWLRSCRDVLGTRRPIEAGSDDST